MQGPTLVLVKTKLGAICGGYTSVNFLSSGGYTNDSTAFVFNMNQKYIPSNNTIAIYNTSNGFEFGNNILSVKGSPLNGENKGRCNVGKENFYDI